MYRNDMRSLIRMAREKEIPISGLFELTARCNLHCQFCYVCDRDNQTECPPEKTTDEWLSMIQQAVDMGMLKCTFTGGDPFMREDFEEIYCKAYDMGLRLGIFTNGILIGKKQRDYLSKRLPDIISISLYGASDETYQKICGGERNFHRTTNSLDGLRAAGIPFELKVLAMRPLMNEYEAMGRIAAMYNCPGKFDSYMCPGRDDPQRELRDLRLPPAQILELFQLFNKQLSSSTITEPEKRKGNDGRVFFCGAGKSSFMITYDGRMLGCPSLTCFDSYPFRDGFASAWRALKEMISTAESCPECADCQERDRCFICPANRLCETGTITACSQYLRERVSSMADMHVEASF